MNQKKLNDMPLENLTKKAQSLLTELVLYREQNPVRFKYSHVLGFIKKSDGLGSAVALNFPALRLGKNSAADLDHLLKESYTQAYKLEHPYVGTEHLLLALLKVTKSPQLYEVRKHVASISLFPNAIKLISDQQDNVILDSFGSNLTKLHLSKYAEPLIYRREFESLLSILLKKDNPNALIIGDPGVGKNTLIHLLVKNINSLEIPTLMAGYQVITFDVMSFIANTINKGNPDQSLQALKTELSSLNRTIVYLKNFQNLFVTTSVGVGIPMLYPLFKDLMTKSDVSFVATLDSFVYEKVISDNEHMLDTFTVLELREPSEEITTQILMEKARALENFHNIKIDEWVVKHIYSSAAELSSTASYPKKSIDLMDLACANLLVRKRRVPADYKKSVDKTIKLYEDMNKLLEEGSYEQALKLQTQIKKLEKTLTTYERKMVYAKPLKLNINDVNEALVELELKDVVRQPMSTEQLGKLADRIRKEIIGQDEAIDSVVKALIRARLGLKTGKRPVGSFLFLGPTGVGKTELAKILAKHAFSGKTMKSRKGDQSAEIKAYGDDVTGEKDSKHSKDSKDFKIGNHLIRLDMSDFAEKHTVSRLVGAPPGYVGYSEGGELTSKIETTPDSVVLFDEIEKAHPDVLNILLQIMDEGELSDAKGNVYDFSKAIIILTSNIGTEILHNKEIGFIDSVKVSDDKKVATHLKQNLRKILKPELINRFDEIIVFRRLQKKEQKKILDLLVSEVIDNMKKQDINVQLKASAKNFLIDKGYSDEYGARALRRVVEKELVDKVADVLMETQARPLKLTFEYTGGEGLST